MRGIKSVANLALGVSLLGLTGYFLYLLFKNDSDDDYYEPVPNRPKRSEMKIQKDFVRLLIGRNGTNIQDIEARSNTKIRFKDQNKDEDFRICVIRGTSQSCGEAESLIHEFLANQPVIVSEEMRIPRVAIGRVIGRCGERINFITQLSGAKIRILGADDPRSEERRIGMKGTSEQIKVAKSYITEVVEEDAQMRMTLETKLAQREPRGKPKADNSSKDDVTKLSAEKLTSNVSGGDGQMEVYVATIIDPSQFWLQIVGPKANELDQLVDEMTDYYSKKENQEMDIIAEPAVGEIVAAPFMCDGKWYRAEIVELKIKNEIKVAQLYYLDYGDTDVVPVDQLFELRTDFLRLRFQAIECFLSRVKPVGDNWSVEAVDCFEDLTYVAQWKKLRVRVNEYKERDAMPGRARREGSPVPGVDLYDVNNQEDLDIAEELVKKGFAVFEENVRGSCELKNGFSASSGSIGSKMSNEGHSDYVVNGNVSDSTNSDTLLVQNSANPEI